LKTLEGYFRATLHLKNPIVMCSQLKPLSANQLEYLIQKAIHNYNGEEYEYTIKDLNSPNVNSTEEKLTFKVEIRCKSATENKAQVIH